jgi:predicted HicB family RNase H-like nuclease
MTTTLPDVSHYTYRITWSPEDHEFVATCVEFPSLSWLAPRQDRALRGVTALVTALVADLAANGEQVPTPLAERRYAGTFNLRLGPQLHRQLAVAGAGRPND